MKMKLGLFDGTTPEFSASVDYLNVCFVPKADIGEEQVLICYVM
jgi:hypothetical protein